MNRLAQYRGQQSYDYDDYNQPGPSSRTYDGSVCDFCNTSLNGDGRQTRRTKCGHTFHLDCMNEYLPETKHCPTCNTQIRWIDIDGKCAVCLDYLDDNSTLVPFCQHSMHRDCVKQWFVTKKRCPICRKYLNFDEDISDYEEEEYQDEEEFVELEELGEEEEDESYPEDHSEALDVNSYYADESNPNDYSAQYSSSEDYDDYSIASQQYENEKDCGYCGRELNISNSDLQEPLKRLHCGHIFHFRCANIYLPEGKKCLTCDTSVPNWINTNDMCVQCMKIFKPTTKKRYTCICEHQFHYYCLKTAKRIGRCPICRCKIEEKVDSICSICLEVCSSDSLLTTCNHRFHYNCIEHWKAVNSICPICRKDL